MRPATQPAGGPANFNEAVAHIHAGRYGQAAAAAEAHVREYPKHPDGWALLGAACLSLGRTAEARRASERALELAPKDARAHYQVAASFLSEGRFAEMERAIERGVKACGREPMLIGVNAERLHALGDYEGACAEARPLVEARTKTVAVQVAYARSCIQVGRAAEAAAALRAFLAGDDLAAMTRASATFALSEVLHAMGEHDAAFVALKEGHDLKNRAPPPEVQSRAVDAMLAAWTPEAIAALPTGPRTEVPVFIVGFWRSGTTLVEQIVSAHPRVFGAGELTLIPVWVNPYQDRTLPSGEPLLTDLSCLTRDRVKRLNQGYLSHVRRLAPRAARVTDKLPTNFVHLGLISRAFPGARVVHCVRDAMDTCLSCYFNLQGNLTYCHDLRALGSFYRDYERIMAHWNRVLDLPILEVRYEEMVADQPGNARRLVEFLGLEWDEACLRPHENTRIALTRSIDQVRKPVYTSSVGRWRRYERHLGPLLEGLGLAGAARAG